jgi:hypothetical protein
MTATGEPARPTHAGSPWAPLPQAAVAAADGRRGPDSAANGPGAHPAPPIFGNFAY